MDETFQLDATDRRIVRALQRDAGQTITFKVSGLANGPTTKAKMTLFLMKATE